MRSVLRAERIAENGNSISSQRAISSPDSAIVSHSHARRGQDVICDHVDDVRPKVDRARCESLSKKKSSIAFRMRFWRSRCQPTVQWRSMILVIAIAHICGGVFSVKSEYRPNLEF